MAHKELITDEQWKMPVSFDSKGRPVSLQDYVQSDRDRLSFTALSEDQRTDLAARRIEMLPTYEIATIGAGVVNKERAIDEVRSRSKLGRTLIEIQTRVVTHLIDEASKRKD
jgi:hypothetical protein